MRKHIIIIVCMVLSVYSTDTLTKGTFNNFLIKSEQRLGWVWTGDKILAGFTILTKQTCTFSNFHFFKYKKKQTLNTANFHYHAYIYICRYTRAFSFLCGTPLFLIKTYHLLLKAHQQVQVCNFGTPFKHLI